MGFREVWLMPCAAVNRRFRTGKHRNPPENLPLRTPAPPVAPRCNAGGNTGTSHPTTSDGLPRFRLPGDALNELELRCGLD